MSALQEQVIQQVGNLSEENLQFLSDMINRFMIPEKTIQMNISSKPRGLKAAGGLHKYADPSKIEQEKDAWRKAAIKKHGRE